MPSVHFGQERFAVERLWRPGLFAFNEGLSKGLELGFVLFKQAKPGAHDIACGAITSLFDLRCYEAGEVISQGNRGVACHEYLLA